MRASEFLTLLDHVPTVKNRLRKIVSIDQIPRTLKVRHFLIINTDVSSKPGRHWFIILKVAAKHYELFDSLGSSNSYVRQHIPYSGICQVNETPVQKQSSSSCGEFCLYFIIHRLFNLDLSFLYFLNDFF